MDPFMPDDHSTRDDDLADWRAFSLAYYEPILRALRLLRAPEGELEDLAHSFLVKAAERDFLGTFRAFRRKQGEAGRPIRFRTYLYRSIQNHVRDLYRTTGKVARAHGLDSGAALVLADGPVATLDPDALYALDVLHQAIQALRRHCERSGKPQYWVFFEELYLADEFRGRRGRSRAELLHDFPEFDGQRLDNALTTVKRAFRRLVEELIPRGLRGQGEPGERFQEWMEILRGSHASQFDRLHVAYRVMPYLDPGMSHARSTALIVGARPSGDPAPTYAEPSQAAEDDELSILVGFYLERPLAELVDPAELMRCLPARSLPPPPPRDGSPVLPGRLLDLPRAPRVICLLSLIRPTPGESEAMAGGDLVGLLSRLKVLAKQLYHRRDHAVPAVVSQLLYTVASVLSVIRCEVDLHTIGTDSLAGNIRWFLSQPWLDDRIRPVLLEGLEALSGTADPGSSPPAS